MRRRAVRRLLGGAILLALVVGCVGGRSDGPPGDVSIVATPDTALMDVPVAVTVSGLRPGAAVTVATSATDDEGVRWSSRADFAAGEDGTVSLDQAPTGGSYSGAHPMGLFTTMTPQSRTERTAFIAGGGYPVVLEVSVGNRPVAATRVRRQSDSEAGVRERVLRPDEDGVYGTLFLPADTSRRRPAVVAFGGSEGGQGMDFTGSLLAAHGYPVLSLAYFAAPGLPPTLERIPIEYFARAAALLRRQPGVDPRQVLAWGVSYGGEAALLLGVHFPDAVSGVIATVSSDHVNRGLASTGRSTESAWTLDGRQLPFAAPTDFRTPGAPGSPASVIPVERIAGPVFTVCGGDDQVIPSCPLARAVAGRRGPEGTRRGDVHLVYPRAGHAVGGLSPYYSTIATTGTTAAGITLRLGGTAADDATAAGAARARLLDFLAALD